MHYTMDSPSGCGHFSPGPDVELPGESWSPEPAKRSMRQARAVWGPIFDGRYVASGVLKHGWKMDFFYGKITGRYGKTMENYGASL